MNSRSNRDTQLALLLIKHHHDGRQYHFVYHCLVPGIVLSSMAVGTFLLVVVCVSAEL